MDEPKQATGRPDPRDGLPWAPPTLTRLDTGETELAGASGADGSGRS